MEIAKIWVSIGAKLDNFNKGMTDVQRSMQKVGKKFTAIGKQMSMKVTLPIIAAAAASIKFSTDFNKAMSNVATLIPGNVNRIKELKKATQDMAITTGQGTNDIAEGLYQVISAYGDTVDTVKILNTTVRAGVAGMATTKDALNLLSAVTKGYGDITAKAVQKAADLSFITVKLGQTTFPELAASIGAVVPLAAQLKVKQEELFAVFATLTGVTGNAAMVSTQFAGILRAMIKPTESMKKAMAAVGKQIGLGAKATAGLIIQKLGLIGAMKALTGQTDGTTRGIAKLFSRVEGLTGLLPLLNTQSKVYNQKLKQMYDRAGAADKAFKEIAKGVNKVGFGMSQLKQMVIVLGQKIGDSLAPVLGKVIIGFKFLTDKLMKLPGPIKAMIIVFAGLAAAIGPILIIVGQMGLAFAAFGTTLGTIAAPIGIAVAAIAGLVAIGYLVVKNWNKISGFLKEVWVNIAAVAKAIWATIGETVKKAVNFIIKIFTAMYSPLIKVGKAIGKGLITSFTWLGNRAKDIFNWMARKIIDALTWLMSKIAKIPIVKKFAKNLHEALKETQKKLEETSLKAADAGAKIDENLKPALVNTKLEFDNFTGSAKEANEKIKAVYASSKEFMELDFKVNIPEEIKKITGAYGDLVPAIGKASKATEDFGLTFTGIGGDVETTNDKIAKGTIKTTKTVESVWKDMAESIRSKWINELSAALQGAKSFKDALKGVWGTIKTQFFDLVAKMITKWTLSFVANILSGGKNLFSGISNIFSGIGKALTGSGSGSGSGGLFGGLSGSFLGSIAKMAGPIGIGLLAAKFLDLKQIGKSVSKALSSAFEVVGGIIKGIGKVFDSVFGAAANIISGLGNFAGALGNAISSLGKLFKAGGKKYGEITFWLKTMKNIEQNMLNRLTVIRTKATGMFGPLNLLGPIKGATERASNKLKDILSLNREIRNHTKDMAKYLKGLAGFQGGGSFTVSKPTLIKVDPNELINITPFSKTGIATSAAQNAGTAPSPIFHNNITINAQKLDDSTINEAADKLFAAIEFQRRRRGY